MRNIQQFPITENEVLYSLQVALNDYQEKELIGGTNGFILHGIHELFKNDPKAMEKLLQSLKF